MPPCLFIISTFLWKWCNQSSSLIQVVCDSGTLLATHVAPSAYPLPHTAIEILIAFFLPLPCLFALGLQEEKQGQGHTPLPLGKEREARRSDKDSASAVEDHLAEGGRGEAALLLLFEELRCCIPGKGTWQPPEKLHCWSFSWNQLILYFNQ